MFHNNSKPNSEPKSRDQRLANCRRQIEDAIETAEISDRSAARMLASLADEWRARVLLAPTPPVAPKVHSGNIPERPKLRSALASLISGA